VKLSKADAKRNLDLFKDFERIANEMGLSQQERTRIMGVPQPTYAMWCKGRAPSNHLALSLAKGRLMSLRGRRMAGNLGDANGHPPALSADVPVVMEITGVGAEAFAKITAVALTNGGSCTLRRRE
jgi:hypothetical protein